MKFSALVTAAIFGSAFAQLDTKIKSKQKVYYGNILDSNTLGQQQAENILRTEFGAITAENAMKWDATERKPSRGRGVRLY
jgi:endo-1,4-beta-xylanase